MTFEELLHPVVATAALQHFHHGHYRDAMLNGIIAAFDLLRTRTGLDLDGADLVNQAFSVQRPHLLVADLQTETGRNAQVGAMMFARGLYQGVRSPTAHTIAAVKPLDAARYLVAASALTELILAAHQGDILRFDGMYVRPNDDVGGTTFLRFFEAGQVLVVSVGGAVEPDWVPNWLTLDWAEWQKQHPTTYSLEGTRLRFVKSIAQGEVSYEGQVRGPKLLLRVHSAATGHRSEGEYLFRPLPRGAA